jgi:FkbH-like protein
MLTWLPVAPDARSTLRAAPATVPAAERVMQLAALAGHRLTLVETIQLDRALRDVGDVSAEGFWPVRVAILSDATVDHLWPDIRVAGLRRRLLIQGHATPFGQYRQSLLDPTSGLHQFHPDVIVLSLTARSAIGSLHLTATRSEVDDRIAAAIGDLRMLWRRARSLAAIVIQQNLVDVSHSVFGSYDGMVAATPSQLVARFNHQLIDAATEERVSILDVARASQRDGLDAWFDTTRWLQGKLAIAPQAAPMYGELATRIIAAHRGLSRKCLVLDLDNTLWGGVVGDDGLEGIVLGEGSGRGEAHLAVQRYAQQLGERGIILAVCSKNDPAIVMEVFDRHPEMILRRNDIACFAVNWDDKSENLKKISAELNIGLDSLVFVDDNPAERRRIRQSLPVVAVPELPDDVGQYVRCVSDAGYFEAVAFTPDDRQRQAQYRANASRDAFRDSSESLDDYLRGLEMAVVFGPVSSVDSTRVCQLINKTNQFNPTTRRYSLEDVTRFASSDRHVALQFRLLDRFGDNGIVSAMLLKPGTADDIMDIDVWVMSCRVFGRQLEFEVMNIAVEAARHRGARALTAEYIPTSRNGVVRELYQGLGFERMCDGAEPGVTRWRLTVADYERRSTHIARRPLT